LRANKSIEEFGAILQALGFDDTSDPQTMQARIADRVPGREFEDLYEDWARAREVGEDGCVLVRPDMHIAWRANGMADDPAAELHSVLSRVLALPI